MTTKTPEDCHSMEDVRAGVDELDRELVRMLVIRQGYMEAAARIKPTIDDVRVPWRIEDVVEKVLESAKREGLNPRIAEPVWRQLIECCIAHEAEHWKKLRAER
ncbi:MAG: chorismate mutase [Pseudomonadota bacterium]